MIQINLPNDIGGFVGFSENWNKENIIKVMASASLFESLDTPQIESLLSCGKLSVNERDTVLVHQGDIADHLYLTLEGSIKTLRTSERGDEAILQLLHPGDTFMEAFIILNEPSPLYAQVVTDATILAISASAVRKLACTDLRFSQALLKVISRQYKEALLIRSSLLLRSPAQRVAHYLLNLLVEAGDTHKSIKLPYQKSMIANHLGMKPETFSRALAELKNLGVRIERDEITLPTGFSLCQFCDMDIALKCQHDGATECQNIYNQNFSLTTTAL